MRLTLALSASQLFAPLHVALFCAALLPVALADKSAPPIITWVSDPVRPDEAVLLQGDGFDSECSVELGQFPDTPTALPKTSAALPVQRWEKLQGLQVTETSLKFVVPPSWPVGVWACRVRRGDAVSEPVVLNAPEPWWWNGDCGESASPGGWLRVFGKSLHFGGASRAVLRAGDGRVLALDPADADVYALRFALPPGFAAGDYELFLHNGLGGDAAWRSGGTVIVRPCDAWKLDVFNVKDFGPRPAEALLAALKKAEENGGGIVFLPRGRYPVKGPLTIPPGTVLRGEAMELVSLYWPDFDDPPQELVTGENFGIESLTLYCQHHRNVVSDKPASRRFFARKVRVRANCFFMIEDVGKEFRNRRGPSSHRQCGAVLLLRGTNFEVTDCDIYASNKGLQIRDAKAGIVARNQIRYGGRGYNIENTARLIFEDNLVSGAHLLAIGNDITTFWSNSCRHIYYARNRVQQMFGADREMMTLDAAGGAYSGKLAAVDGAKLTLAADPVFKDYAPKPHTNWTGAAVQILDGKGAGQYRFVVGHAGREWEVDRAWTVPPDATSRISIAPFRGRNLFIGNSFEDGGAFQLYGAAHDSIVAGNRGSRMDGFLVWGLNPHGWGQQPSWGCQFLDNEIIEGNGYGGRTGGFGIVSGDDPKVYDGPLVRNAVFRRNLLHNNAGIQVGGVTDNVLVEHCVVRNSDTGITVKPEARGVLLRDNRFERVDRPVQGYPSPSQEGPAAPVEFHVSPAGNDSGAGTAEEPFATLARAQRAARQAKGGTVIVHAGTYYLPETIQFTPADNGSAYRAAAGAAVVLSGGSKLDLKWEPFRDGIMKAAAPRGIAADQLFISGQRQRMARYPNYDANVRPYGGFAPDAFSRERAARWNDPSGGFIHAMHRAHWGGYHYRITGKDAKGEVMYEGGWQNNRQMGMHPEHRYVENIFEELDAPEEWFHDAKTGTLYSFPPAGTDLKKATVEVVRLRHLVEFAGSRDRPVRNVTLEGLVFRHAARTFMDVKEPLLRSDWTIYRGGAVLFNGAEDCAVLDCEFDQLGGNAVFVNNYNRRILVRGCDLHDTGASALAFVGDPKAVRNPLFEYRQRQTYGQIDKTPGPQSDNYPADCLVEDCLIRRMGVVEKQATGVQISMALGITVRHCSIYEASRAGINVSEGTFGGHVIEFCDVFDTVRETGDHGSFNSWGRDRFWGLPDAPAAEMPELARLDMVKPNVIRNSRWRCDHGWDVDLDDGSSNYEIYNNLFLHGGLKLREGFHRKVWNNVAVNNTLHPHVWYENSGDEVRQNIWMGAYRPALMKIAKWGKEVDRNLFTTSDADRTKFAGSGCDANSLTGNALFVDPAKGDYRVKEGSPALRLGFVNFPMDQFGVQSARLKAMARTPELPVLEEPELGTRVANRPGCHAWLEAKARNLEGEEFSAFGVSKESGGVYLVEVPAGSAAAKFGFQTGDLIQSINSQPVRSFDELIRRQNEAAGPLRAGIVRGQQPRCINIGQRR